MAMCRELLDQLDWTSCLFCQSPSPDETLIRITEEEPNVEIILGYLKHNVKLYSKSKVNKDRVASEGKCHLSCFKTSREKTINIEQENLIANITHTHRRDVEKGSLLLISDLWKHFCIEAQKTKIGKDIITLPKYAFRKMVQNQMSDVADFVVNDFVIPKKFGIKTISKTVDDHTYSGMLQVAAILQRDMQHQNVHGTGHTSTSSPESLNTFFSLLSRCKTTPDDKANTLLKDTIAKELQETNKPLERYTFIINFDNFNQNIKKCFIDQV